MSKLHPSNKQVQSIGQSVESANLQNVPAFWVQHFCVQFIEQQLKIPHLKMVTDRTLSAISWSFQMINYWWISNRWSRKPNSWEDIWRWNAGVCLIRTLRGLRFLRQALRLRLWEPRTAWGRICAVCPAEKCRCFRWVASQVHQDDRLWYAILWRFACPLVHAEVRRLRCCPICATHHSEGVRPGNDPAVTGSPMWRGSVSRPPPLFLCFPQHCHGHLKGKRVRCVLTNTGHPHRS